MDDSNDPALPAKTAAARLERLREQLRRQPIVYRSRFGYPANPGLSWIDRLP